MTKETSKEAGRKFVQVSLSQDFAAELRRQADAADRSMASQLEHWAKVARAIESVVPAGALGELKGGRDPGEVLSRVGAYLLNQNPSALKARLAGAQSPRYGVDDDDPEVAVRIDPDGTQTRGRFDAAGNFIPAPAATERMQDDDRPKSKAPKRTESRPAKGSRSSSAGQRNPVSA
jgi:hypothetical protein